MCLSSPIRENNLLLAFRLAPGMSNEPCFGQQKGPTGKSPDGVESKFSRVPDAVQRSPGDANGSRECAPDDRPRIVRSRCSASLAGRVLPRAV
jgi:hypothetical protein